MGSGTYRRTYPEKDSGRDEEMNSFRIPEAGAGYVPETKIKCYWEICIEGNEVRLIQRGGPLEPIVLTIEASVEPSGYEDPEWVAKLEVTDCWDWGD